jgi:DNA repair protein RadA/Sms
MAKNKGSYYLCRECGHQEAKWSGQCPSCGQWNSLESVNAAPVPASGSVRRSAGEPRPLSQVEIREDARLSSGISELDRVLGGGIIRGSSVLLGGEPGIGKSTLMLQAASAYAAAGPVLYISGEEAPEQIKMRAARLGIDGKQILIHNSSIAEQCADQVLRRRPAVVIVDSIQTLISDESGSAPGSPNQVKYSVQMISEAARGVSASCFFIAHVTKDGSIAGPKQVEHLVDAVLYFDHSEHELRFLRTSKNRFGSSDEVGLFSMESRGLVEVSDPTGLFLSEEEEEAPPGTAVVPVYEGSRILMVEIQALTVPGKGGFGRVYSDRIDQRRVSRVAAVLEKHLNLRLSDQDIYVNVAGGIRLADVGIELALAMVVYSARTGLALPAKAALCGEISLSGRVRSVPHLKRRHSQASDLGYSPILIPAARARGASGSDGISGKKTHRIKALSEAVGLLFGNGAGT